MAHVIEVYTNSYADYGLEAVLGHLPLPLCRAVEMALKVHMVKEAMVTDRDTLTETASVDAVAAMRERFLKAGIAISSVNGGDRLSDPAGMGRVLERMEIAERLGAQTFVASFGWRDEPAGIFPLIRELGEEARRRGMVLALETHAPLVKDADAALRTLDTIRCDNVGINWDTANIYYMNEGIDGAAELRRIANRVVHVHLKDSRKRVGEWFFPALGEGTIDFAEVVGILDDAGFRGKMSLEIEGIEGETADLATRRRRIEDSLEHLAKIGVV